MKSIKFSKLLASLSFFACASLSAAPMTLDVNVAGIQSHGEIDDSQNTVLNLNVGANSLITSVRFDVDITAFFPSYLSEIGLLFEASDLTGSLSLFPGGDDESSGTGAYEGFYDLADIEGVDRRFNVGSDGILRLQFFEGFDDFDGADGQWNFGTITFGFDTVDVEEPGEVPEPATTLLMGAGLAMLGYAGRRRRTAGKAAA